MQELRNCLLNIGEISGRKTAVVTGMATLLFLLSSVLFSGKAVSTEIQSEGKKKAVALTRNNAEAESIFLAACGTCHKLPDPASSVPRKKDCASNASQADLAKAQKYVLDVQAGKALYSSNCGQCHTLIAPESHTFKYWSRNLCTSDSCLITQLNSVEEQQLLLYLSAHSRSD